jgi:dihydrolipoamide dehydrogenase
LARVLIILIKQGAAMESQYDLAVIGSGPSGYVAAIRAAQLKLKTVLIEEDKLGGICLNWGCIPTKALLKSAETYALLKHVEEFGIQVEKISFDFNKIIQRSRKVADLNSKGVEFLMKKNKINVIYGRAKILNRSSIEISTKEGKKSSLTCKNMIIATGGRPRTIPGIEIDNRTVIDYRLAMSLSKQPKSMIIIGAGAIGVEFAYFYNELGTRVTILEMLDSILPLEDREITAILSKNFRKNNIEIHTSAKVEALKNLKDGIEVTFSKEGKKEVLSAELALMAIGIQGNVENLGLEEQGIKIEHGFISVNQWYETNVPGLYAIGDIIGPPLLAHVASHEGIICVEKIAHRSTRPLDYDSIPGCTYCQPQVASIGLSEEKAEAAGLAIKIGRFPYTASGKARAMGDREGLVKLIFNGKYGELLGAHIIGAEATELIAELSLAKSLESTAVELNRTVHAHPTLSEMIMEAAGDSLGEAIHI